jgi:hypothetical protein
VKRGIVSKARAVVLYDAYVLDYGCYVDLLATRDGGPKGMFPTDNDSYLDVPPDTFDDAMRGAILDPSAFEARQSGALQNVPPPVEIAVRSTIILFIVPSDDMLDVMGQIDESGWYLLTELSGHIAAISIGHRSLTIGSSTSSHIRVRNGDLLVKHATLSRADPHVAISNPQHSSVYINGRRSRNKPLADRDKIRMGEVEFVVVHKS